ncbi:MAG: hypothetical protein U1C71_01365, partial [archaeon]|nr:hypothetical protein [archaeon]
EDTLTAFKKSTSSLESRVDQKLVEMDKRVKQMDDAAAQLSALINQLIHSKSSGNASTPLPTIPAPEKKDSSASPKEENNHSSSVDGSESEEDHKKHHYFPHARK